MIRNSKPLSIVESLEYIDAKDEAQVPVLTFFKQFSKIKLEDAQALKAELENLQFIKLRETHIAKIIDLLPQNAEELHKIVVDVSLDENEVSQIIGIVAKFK